MPGWFGPLRTSYALANRRVAKVQGARGSLALYRSVGPTCPSSDSVAEAAATQSPTEYATPRHKSSYYGHDARVGRMLPHDHQAQRSESSPTALVYPAR